MLVAYLLFVSASLSWCVCVREHEGECESLSGLAGVEDREEREL